MPSTAGEIMLSAAALMNDVQQQIHSYTNQFPYLKIALKDFKELAQLNDFAVSNITSTVLAVPADASVINFDSIPALPTSLVEIQQLWQSSQEAGPFTPVHKVQFLNQSLSNVQISSFFEWSWQDNGIKVWPALAPVYLKIDYISTLFSTIVDQNSNLQVINADSFLHYRLAGLLAEFVEENPERASSLNGNAGLAFDRILGIESKSSQQMPARRRPFRGGRRIGR